MQTTQTSVDIKQETLRRFTETSLPTLKKPSDPFSRRSQSVTVDTVEMKEKRAPPPPLSLQRAQIIQSVLQNKQIRFAPENRSRFDSTELKVAPRADGKAQVAGARVHSFRPRP